MAGTRKVMSNAVAVALVALVAVMAAAGADSTCGMGTQGLLACMSYCRIGSSEDAPSQGCCSALAHADFGCLCGYKNDPRVVKRVNGQRVMDLPSKCNIQGAPKSC